MSKDPAPQAEGLKYAEKKDRATDSTAGGGPEKIIFGEYTIWNSDFIAKRPRRKRGWVRARKRGEPWAQPVKFHELLGEYFNYDLLKEEMQKQRSFFSGLYYPTAGPKPPEDCF